MFISRLLTFLSLLLLVSAERIVRFISTDGKEYYGDAILPANFTDAAHSTTARVIQGDILGDFTVTKQIKVGTTARIANSRALNDCFSKSKSF
jgi:hypothetical protein